MARLVQNHYKILTSKIIWNDTQKKFGHPLESIVRTITTIFSPGTAGGHAIKLQLIESYSDNVGYLHSANIVTLKLAAHFNRLFYLYRNLHYKDKIACLYNLKPYTSTDGIFCQETGLAFSRFITYNGATQNQVECNGHCVEQAIISWNGIITCVTWSAPLSHNGKSHRHIDVNSVLLPQIQLASSSIIVIIIIIISVIIIITIVIIIPFFPPPPLRIINHYHHKHHHSIIMSVAINIILTFDNNTNITSGLLCGVQGMAKVYQDIWYNK